MWKKFQYTSCYVIDKYIDAYTVFILEIENMITFADVHEEIKDRGKHFIYTPSPYTHTLQFHGHVSIHWEVDADEPDIIKHLASTPY